MTGGNRGRGRRRSLGNLDFWVGSPMGSIYLLRWAIQGKFS